jgi:hypothetical protein
LFFLHLPSNTGRHHCFTQHCFSCCICCFLSHTSLSGPFFLSSWWLQNIKWQMILAQNILISTGILMIKRHYILTGIILITRHYILSGIILITRHYILTGIILITKHYILTGIILITRHYIHVYNFEIYIYIFMKFKKTNLFGNHNLLNILSWT